MKATGFCAAIFAALLFAAAARAQDVTLTSRDGSLSLSGTLQGYDGEFFRIETSLRPADGGWARCDLRRAGLPRSDGAQGRDPFRWCG